MMGQEVLVRNPDRPQPRFVFLEHRLDLDTRPVVPIAENAAQGAHLQLPVLMLNVLVQLLAGGEAILQGRLLSKTQALRLRKEHMSATLRLVEVRPLDTLSFHGSASAALMTRCQRVLGRAAGVLEASHLTLLLVEGATVSKAPAVDG